MRHIGCFRSVDEDLPVRAQSHAFRLDSDLHLAEPSSPLHIDDGNRIVVLVRHIENLPRWILAEQLRIGAGRQRGDDLVRLGIDHLNRVVVPDRHQNEFSILGELDTARPLTHLNRLYHDQFVGIDYADRIALLIRDIGGEGARWRGEQENKSDAAQPTSPCGKAPRQPKARVSCATHLSLHLLSGRSVPSVSSSET